MYLKKIELQGFKSFAMKMTFDLSAGLTGFVGPNGCGKSNIVDAVKWGLGEQRVSSLRGDNMQDVIFKGNGTRPPMNFAEVDLYFENGEGALPLDYEEVVITRRLYRSGESEYMINRANCRLKDIRNLFLDTGIGVNAYSMMEQGRIDAILQANPIDRRTIFEEAAGISRFKSRRKEAERKLERTQANLLRVGDIIEELERRIRSLKNQAGRARSYLKLNERLKELKGDHFLHRFRVLKDESREIESRMGDAAGEAKRLFTEQVRKKEDLSTLEKETDLLMDDLSAKKTKLAEVKTLLDEIQGKIGYLENRIRELGEEGKQLEDRAREVADSLEGREKDHRDIERRIEELSREERRIAEEENRCVKELVEVERAWKKEMERQEELKGEAVELARKEVDLKNHTVEAQARFRGSYNGLVRLSSRQNGLALEIADLALQLSITERCLGEKEKERGRLTEHLRERREKVCLMEEGLKCLDDELKDKDGEIIKRESRIELLQTLIERREGVSIGAKAVLEEGGKENSPLSFVRGMLGELLEVDMPHSMALEAALGDVAEAVVVEELDQARQVMEFVEREEKGQVTILTLSLMKESGGNADLDDDALARHVQCPHEKISKAIAILLKDVRIIPREGLTDGRLSRDAKYVTLRGDRMDRFGILTTGGEARERGVISRRSELAALIQECEEHRTERDDLSRRKTRSEKELHDISRANEELAGRLETQNEAVAELNKERERGLERWIQVRREYTQNAREAYELERSCFALREELDDLKGERGCLEQDLDLIEDALRAAHDGVDEQSRNKDRIIEKRRELEFTRVRFGERMEGVEKEKRMVEQYLEEARCRQEDLKRDRERIRTLKADLDKDLRDMRGRIDDLLDSRSTLSSEVAEKTTRLEESRENLERRKEDLQQAEGHLEEVRRRMEDLRVIERENQVKIEALAEKARDELTMDLQEELDRPDQEWDPHRDWDEVEREIQEIRERLGRMGNVNLEAIQELEEVEGRYNGLVVQRDDLLKSIKSLNDLILDLNKESREKFIAAFEAIKGHFNHIFRRLFQGGRADLRLRENEDVLEAGVDIIAGPPGKDVRSISLLSGGERTLTAVGLLFALFKSRPSPFCILDEVDAALDEVNIERFCNLLGDYVEDSQFIIVTHSKRTMSYCDHLYGITMQENGVSSQISLDLKAYEDQVA